MVQALPYSVLRKLLLVGASLMLVSGPAVAQGLSRRPATNEEVLKYQYMAGLSVCILTQQGVPFKTAFPAANVMTAVTLRELNGSEINQGSKVVKLTEQQLESGGVPGIVGAVDGLCGKNLKGEDKVEFDKLKSQVQAFLKSATTKP
jgi:hypothetical protein